MKHGVIRNMEERDVPEVVAIERQSFTMPWSETSFLGEIHKRHGIAIVAETGGRISGYLCANMVLDEGHLLDIAAHPDVRRTGIGTCLLSAAEDALRARGCRVLYLELRISNAAAHRFYEKHSFRDVGIRKKYYDNPPEDARIMMKTFG